MTVSIYVVLHIISVFFLFYFSFCFSSEQPSSILWINKIGNVVVFLFSFHRLWPFLSPFLNFNICQQQPLQTIPFQLWNQNRKKYEIDITFSLRLSEYHWNLLYAWYFIKRILLSFSFYFCSYCGCLNIAQHNLFHYTKIVDQIHWQWMWINGRAFYLTFSNFFFFFWQNAWLNHLSNKKEENSQSILIQCLAKANYSYG